MVSLLAKGPGIIEGAARIELPPDMIARGDIQDFSGVAKVVSAMLDSLYGAKRGKVRVGVSLPETVVYSKVFSLPAVLDGEQVDDALGIGATDGFPVESGSNQAYDYMELEESNGARHFLYVTAETRVIRDYMNVIAAANAEPVFIEPESSALTRALIPPGESRPVMVADIGARTTLLACFDDRGEQIVSAAIPLGGEILTAEIERRLQLSMEEAEKLKVKAGFDDDLDGGRILMIMQKPFEDIVSEIRRTIEYVSRVRDQKIARIILAGGTSLLPKIAEYVALSFEGIEVTLGRPLERVAVADSAVLPKNFNKDAVLFSTAIGLGMRCADTRGHPGPDLHPAARRSERGSRGFTRLRDIIDKVSRLMPISKRKTQAKKPASGKSSITAPKKKKDVKTPRAKPQAPAAIAPAVPAAVEAIRTEPVEPVTEAPKSPEPAVEQPTAGIEPPTEALDVAAELAEGAEEKEGADEAGQRGATTENPERDFGMGVGELLGSAVGRDEEEEAEEAVSVQIRPASARGADEEGGERLSLESILSGKAPEETKHEAPTTGGRGLNWRIIVPIIVFLLALVVIAAGAGVFRSLKEQGTSQRFLDAVVALFGKDEDSGQVGPEDTSDQAPVAPTAVTVNVLVMAGQPEEGLALPIVQSRVIETDVVLEETFEATGTAQSGDAQAIGTITIINELPRTFSFVARTRFLSPDGVLFRMKNPADIPANGSVDVEVYADKTGPGSDIGPSDFTIPGLSEDLQKSVYGRSSAAMTGGSGTVAAVSEQDIEAARTALMEKLSAEARENFKSMVGESELVLDGLITSKAGDETAPAAGTVGASFKMKLTAQFRALLVPAAGIVEILGVKVAETIPAGDDPAAYQLGEAIYSVEAYDTASDKAELRVEAPLQKI